MFDKHPSAPKRVLKSRQCLGLLMLGALLAMLPGHAAAKPDLMDHLAARAWGELAGRAVNDFVDLVGTKAQISARIAMARREFFRQYPDGRDLEAARERFQQLLLGKDVMYLSTGVISGLDEPGERRRFREYGTIGLSGVAGEIDGGISLLARPAFARLVKAMRADIKASNRAKHGRDGVDFGSLTVLPGPFMAALKKNRDAFENYRVWRDYDEFLRAGERMAAYDDPKAYTILMLRLYRGRSGQEATADYEALKSVMGEKAVNDVARQAAGIPQNRTGRMTDIERLGFSLPPRRPKGDNRPTGKHPEGKTILPNALPITVLRALWKRNSKGDLLIEIAEDRDLSYTDAWYLLQKVIRKTGSLNGPQGYVVKTLLRNKHTNVVEAVDGYEALVQAVGEKQLLEAARKVSAIPMDGKGNLTDLKPLGLVRYRDIWDSEKELPAGRSADGRIAVMWALPQTALAALWCKDNPQAYAVQLIVDGRHYGYAEAWGSYQAIAQVVGEEKLLAVAKEIYLAPKRSGGKWKQEFRKRRHMGLLVTPAPPGDEYYMYKPYWKLQTELIAGKDTRTQIRYFIALETHDAQSIDKTHESLVKLKGGKALLAAAERLRAAHWQTDARLPVIEALPRIMNGQSEPWVPRADGPHRPATP